MCDPWASYQIRKIAGCLCAGNTGNVFPSTDFMGNRELATPVCISAPAWPLSAKKPMAQIVKGVNHNKYPFNGDSWWRHQMETFCALLAICAGISPVTCEFPAQRPVTQSFDVFIDLRLNKRLSKQWWGWWFETLSRPLWRHCNVLYRDCNCKMSRRSS